MLRFCKEMLEYYQYSVHSMDWLLAEGNKTTVILIWCLKQLKDFILKFLISGNFFSQKTFFNYYTVILVSFPLGGCGDEVVDNWTNYYC